MTVEELLYQYRSIKKEIAELKERINHIYSSAMVPGIKNITDMPMAQGYSADGLSKVFEQIEELTEVWAQRITELQQVCTKIETAMAGLESIERRVIRYRYMDNKSWNKISNITKYSIPHLHRIHNRAVDKLRSCNIDGHNEKTIRCDTFNAI